MPRTSSLKGSDTNRCHCEEGALPDEAISGYEETASLRQAQGRPCLAVTRWLRGDCFVPRSDTLVTRRLPVLASGQGFVPRTSSLKGSDTG